jgi:hypothetical protein
VAAVCVILILLATARSTHGQTPPAGDYGDAPDGSGALTHYPPMFHTTRSDARFPTEFNTTNSRVGNPGAHHLVVGQEWFGPLTGGVSAEAGTHDPADPDGIANLALAANNDAVDDGLPTVPFFLVLSALLRYRAMEA